MPKARQLIEAISDENLDPKDVALNQDYDSEAFREIMHNFEKHMRDLVKQAKASGAVPDNEGFPKSVSEGTEMMVLKSLLVIAADDFFPGHIRPFKKMLNNLRKFL